MELKGGPAAPCLSEFPFAPRPRCHGARIAAWDCCLRGHLHHPLPYPRHCVFQATAAAAAASLIHSKAPRPELHRVTFASFPSAMLRCQRALAPPCSVLASRTISRARTPTRSQGWRQTSKSVISPLLLRPPLYSQQQQQQQEPPPLPRMLGGECLPASPGGPAAAAQPVCSLVADFPDGVRSQQQCPPPSLSVLHKPSPTIS